MGERTINGDDLEDQRLDQIAIALDQLPRKERSRRAQVIYLSSSILEALAKGYSYNDVAEILNAKGVDISPSTLKQYVYRLKQVPMDDHATPSKPASPSQGTPSRFVKMPEEL